MILRIMIEDFNYENKVIFIGIITVKDRSKMVVRTREVIHSQRYQDNIHLINCLNKDQVNYLS